MALVIPALHRPAVEPHQTKSRARHLKERGKAVLGLRPVMMRRERRAPRLSVVCRSRKPDVVGVGARFRSSAANARRGCHRRAGSTDGTSAQLTNQSWPLATVRGSVQPDAVRSAKRSEASSPARSIQLRRTPRGDTVSCGCALPAGAGDGSADTCNPVACSVRPCSSATARDRNGGERRRISTMPPCAWRGDGRRPSAAEAVV